MSEIVLVGHVAVSAQVKVEAFRALPAHALYATLLAVVANHIRMTNADGCVVEYAQVEFALIANSIVGTRARVPLNNHRFLRACAASLSAFYVKILKITFFL